MTPISGQAHFTLKHLQQTANRLLGAQPDSVVAYRLLRQVLRRAPNDPQLVAAKKLASSSKWVSQLEQSQLPSGSWGRFHTQDTKKKTVFRTTEEAIDRAFALGLEPADHCLARAHVYIQAVLNGKAEIPDWQEKNAAFPVLIKFILAGRLAQIDPLDPLLDLYREYLVEVANQAFSSGNYRLDDEKQAYLRLSSIHVTRGFLQSQHALWILSARQLPYIMDMALVDWIWNKPDGIGYLGAALPEFSSSHFWYWLRSISLISRFIAWREIALETLNRLWDQRDDDGLWDFGPKVSRSIDFPLSDSWRESVKRKMDYSTCILALLRKYFD